MSGDNRVTVSGPPVVGSAEPRFLVKLGDSYFLTLGVWEYNLKKAKTPEQISACKAVIDWFNTHTENDVEARQVPPPERSTFSGGHIG